MAGPWLKYRGHLENISNNMLIGATNAENGIFCLFCFWFFIVVEKNSNDLIKSSIIWKFSVEKLPNELFYLNIYLFILFS